ncbi:M14 family zinc carboxypeptidase [Spirosoma montaniterrae]|uniref:Zinc carboxypeptidase n=1 Tax=Spirosoma montaniterrae TaxID=1178516 RepID=A0A1P9WS52_9BACT|nr:M14 family zinc carboxypeptidase [Spirosoma montaniterrae]AQG78173.1 zinc carboxypeptidase [Spirosoma montaniterrae]
MRQSLRNLFFLSLCLVSCLTQAQTNYFFANNPGPLNPAIPTPEQFLGYPLSSHMTRYDQMVAYFRELARLSDRVHVETIGQTYEHRPLIMALFTSPVNYTNRETIRQNHLKRATAAGGDEVPLVVQIGANVHGNEPSGGESTLLTAYYLAASESDEVKRWLSEMLVFVEPILNPDGRDRFANWANMHKSESSVADPLDREHNEIWPGGRMNHYWFDPNRDWFLCAHPEAQAHVAWFHQWMPYVVVDHHEMGTNATFYFDPGKNSSNNPVVPAYLYDTVYPTFGNYFAKAMNGIGSLYFTKETFDKLYPGYGSSYANFYGGAGFLFEQASARGFVQETTTVPITFAFTIRNQLTAALATLRASMAEKPMLLKLRRDFFTAAANQAKQSTVKGYVFGDPADQTRTNAFVNLLRRHQIDTYELDRDLTAGGRTFRKGQAYVVPTDQRNYLMVRSAFEKQITYSDSLFYDASTWSLIHAFGLPHAELTTPTSKGAAPALPLGKAITGPLTATVPPVDRSPYAYLVDVSDYNAYRALYALQTGGAIVKTSFKPFTVKAGNKNRAFGYGTLVIPVQQQTLAADSLFRLVSRVSRQVGIAVRGVESGFSAQGIDLGSNAVRTLRRPEALLLVGPGVSAYEAGEIWHLLDQRVGMPITKLDLSNLPRTNLNRYTSLIMVSGAYPNDKTIADKVKAWVQSGGTLITLKTATEWAIKQGLTKEKLLAADTTRRSLRYNYDEATNYEGAKALGGSIFQADLDLSHPIGFGFTDRRMSVFKNSQTMLQPSQSPYNTVLQYTDKPLIGGYVHPASLKRVAKSAAILASGDGAGRVVLFADNPNFRATWYGTNKLFLNALFFGSVLTVPSVEGEE